jgi:hypothetical protein
MTGDRAHPRPRFLTRVRFSEIAGIKKCERLELRTFAVLIKPRTGELMAIDQTQLGQQVTALMEEIEQDPEIPSDGAIQRCVLIVEIVSPGENPDEQSFGIRVNSSASPHVSVGFIEVAKQLQLKMMGLA